MLNLLKFIDARLGEPSTYASLAAVLALVNVNVDSGLLHTATIWGAVAAGVLGVVLAEVGSKSPAQVASDAFAAFVQAIKAMPPAALAAMAALPLTVLLLACAVSTTGTQLTTDAAMVTAAVDTVDATLDGTPGLLGASDLATADGIRAAIDALNSQVQAGKITPSAFVAALKPELTQLGNQFANNTAVPIAERTGIVLAVNLVPLLVADLTATQAPVTAAAAPDSRRAALQDWLAARGK